jgi:hypothetical protein
MSFYVGAIGKPKDILVKGRNKMKKEKEKENGNGSRTRGGEQ